MYLKKSSILLFCLCAQCMTAQTVGDLLQITLRDQSTIKGKLIEKKGNDWVIETKSIGNVSLKRQNIIDFAVLASLEGSSFKDLAPSNYWFAPTAIPLNKGEGHYQAGEIVFHTVDYGFTKYFSVNVGFEILSFLSKDAFRGNPRNTSLPVLGYVSPRLNYSVDPNFHLSTGILMGRDEGGALFRGENNALNIFFATATLGNRNHNLTFTYGQRLEKIRKVQRFRSSITNEMQDMNFITLAGKVRLAEHWTILSENWSWTSTFSDLRTTFVSVGVRYSARRFNIGLGILIPFFEGQRNANIPILTFGLPFRL